MIVFELKPDDFKGVPTENGNYSTLRIFTVVRVLNLLTFSIVLWNTVYIGRAVKTLRENGYYIDDTLVQYLSPLGWKHINLIGDYVWSHKGKLQPLKFRPLRPFRKA